MRKGRHVIYQFQRDADGLPTIVRIVKQQRPSSRKLEGRFKDFSGVAWTQHTTLGGSHV